MRTGLDIIRFNVVFSIPWLYGHALGIARIQPLDSADKKDLGQLERLEPGRVCLFKFDSEKSKSLFRKDLP